MGQTTNPKVRKILDTTASDPARSLAPIPA